MMLDGHHHDVRTTLTLDKDVATRLRQEVHRRGTSFKQTVNDLLRVALTQPKSVPSEPFVVRSRFLGVRPGLDLDDIGGLLDELDGPARR